MQSSDRFEILGRLAIAGSRGEQLQPVVETALRQAADLVGLSGAAMYLWDDKMSVTLAVTHSESESAGKLVSAMEEDLFSSLRRDRQLLSAYMSFGGDSPFQSFTMPLQHIGAVFGASIGIQTGGGRLVDQDAFLEALVAAISVNVTIAGAGKDAAAYRRAIDKERMGAVIETAVTVNHEINNPLTAILGNVQLLLLNRKDLDPEMQHKLKTIEESAMRIKEITQRLLRLTSVRTTEYAEGTRMIDLSDDDEGKKK